MKMCWDMNGDSLRTLAAEIRAKAAAVATAAPMQRTQSPAPAPARPDTISFPSVSQWLRYSRNRAVLVEQLYKRENWREALGVVGERDELRRTLLARTSHELAQLLVNLDGR